MGFAEGDYPETERYYREAISLPLYPGLTDRIQQVVVEAVQWVIDGFPKCEICAREMDDAVKRSGPGYSA